MGLLKRLIHPEAADAEADASAATTTLAGSARPMRTTLLALNADREEVDPGRPEIDLRALTTELLRGEVAAPTPDVQRMISTGVDPQVFYEKELSRSWEGLNESQRAARVGQFAGLATMLEAAEDDARPPNYEQMLATVRTKTLLLSFAFDETYGYMPRLARSEDLD